MHGLRHVELVQDLVRHFLDGPRFGVHEDVGLPIERLTFREEPAYLVERVGTMEKWPMGLVAHPVPNGLGRRPQTHHQRVAFQAREVFVIGGQAAARRDDQAALARQSFEHLPLISAKLRLAFRRKDLGDSFGGLFFDKLVRIHQAKAQGRGQEMAHRCFSSTHESNQGNVSNLARLMHKLNLTASAARRH